MRGHMQSTWELGLRTLLDPSGIGRQGSKCPVSIVHQSRPQPLKTKVWKINGHQTHPDGPRPNKTIGTRANIRHFVTQRKSDSGRLVERSLGGWRTGWHARPTYLLNKDHKLQTTWGAWNMGSKLFGEREGNHQAHRKLNGANEKHAQFNKSYLPISSLERGR